MIGHPHWLLLLSDLTKLLFVAKESLVSVLQYIITSKLVRHHHVANDTKRGEYGNRRRCVIKINGGTFPLNNETLTLNSHLMTATQLLHYWEMELTYKAPIEAAVASSFDVNRSLKLVEGVPSSNFHEVTSLSGIIHLELGSQPSANVLMFHLIILSDCL